MDWVLKASTWELSELRGEEDAYVAAAALSGSNSFGVHRDTEQFSVDLRLGRLGDGTLYKLKARMGSTLESSSSRSKKRTRVLNSTQNGSCLVDGCMSDLSKCREYHRRHRVCEDHSKTPIVTIGGREQRFCQQCSRFHSLREFDEVKRSCRKRLDGHNRRRRKPQPESLYMSSPSFMTNHRGAKLLHFGDTQANETTAGGSNLTWPSLDKHHQQFRVIVKQGTSSNSLAVSKQFPFLLTSYSEKGNQAAPEVSTSQRLLETNVTPETGRGSLHRKTFSDELTHLVESNGALSLLSSCPPQTPVATLSHVVHQDPTHLNQPMGSSLQFNGLAQYLNSQGMEEKPVAAVFVPDANNPNKYCNMIFDVGAGAGGLLENEATQLHSFSWN